MTHSTAEALAWAICPSLRKANDEEPGCKQCPAQVETKYGNGTQLCRLRADEAAQAALSLHGEGKPEGEPLVKTVERILDDESAWIARPNRKVTERIAMALVMPTLVAQQKLRDEFAASAEPLYASPALVEAAEGDGWPTELGGGFGPGLRNALDLSGKELKGLASENAIRAATIIMFKHNADGTPYEMKKAIALAIDAAITDALSARPVPAGVCVPREPDIKFLETVVGHGLYAFGHPHEELIAKARRKWAEILSAALASGEPK